MEIILSSSSISYLTNPTMEGSTKIMMLCLLLAVTSSSFAKVNLICYLPPETGPCYGYFPRYYYDSASGTCKEFIYGGCQGNDNNFKTEEECMSACSYSKASTGYAPPPVQCCTKEGKCAPGSICSIRTACNDGSGELKGTCMPFYKPVTLPARSCCSEDGKCPPGSTCSIRTACNDGTGVLKGTCLPFYPPTATSSATSTIGAGGAAGGFGKPARPTDYETAIFNNVKCEFEKEVGGTYENAKPILYQTQVVSGANYRMLVKLDDSHFGIAIAHVPLPTASDPFPRLLSAKIIGSYPISRASYGNTLSLPLCCIRSTDCFGNYVCNLPTVCDDGSSIVKGTCVPFLGP